LEQPDMPGIRPLRVSVAWRRAVAHRFTAFATGTSRGQLADLELRHRRRARCEDRIRCAKDTGLRNLPLKGFAQNQLWCEIAARAARAPGHHRSSLDLSREPGNTERHAHRLVPSTRTDGVAVAPCCHGDTPDCMA
jgi:hypothetical protein